MSCRPDVVFHAAAHKHVPLMELSPGEAVKNNVFGTWNVAQACDKYHVKRMVLISTDKAVNPNQYYGCYKTYLRVDLFNTAAVTAKIQNMWLFGLAMCWAATAV